MRKNINKDLFAQVYSLVGKVSFSPRIKFLTSNFLILVGTDTRVSLKDFAQTLKRNNAEVPDIYFTSLHAADDTPSLVF